MEADAIHVHGARAHNLKNIDVSIPRDKITVITGLSGSGKSSLAFDTLYAEGQRRYIESMSLHARQFIEQMEKPEVDLIEGLSPAIAIEQKTSSRSHKSTVGTVTEIYDFLRLLYSRIGIPKCPTHNQPIQSQSIEQISKTFDSFSKEAKIFVYAVYAHGEKGTFEKEFESLRKKGFSRVRVDGKEHSLSDINRLEKNILHDVHLAIDRFKNIAENRPRLLEALEQAVEIGKGRIFVNIVDETKSSERFFNTKAACPICFFSFPELVPRLFSFNSPYGMCLSCQGRGAREVFESKLLVPATTQSLWDYLGEVTDLLPPTVDKAFRSLFKKHRVAINSPTADFSKDFRQELEARTVGLFEDWFLQANPDEQELLSSFRKTDPCQVCEGSRIGVEGRSVSVKDLRIHEITGKTISELIPFLERWSFSGTEHAIAEKILPEIQHRLRFLIQVGVGYLSLDRSTATLSGGEAQRVRLASQLGTELSGVLYILDEPSIGLHPRDHSKLLDALKQLRDQGNTVIIVEHDEETIRSADHLIDIGPAAGTQGGKLIFNGSPDSKKLSSTLTGQYLSGERSPIIQCSRQWGTDHTFLELKGCSGHNLNNVSIRIPHRSLTVITGVSGSGKSSLISETLYPALKKALTNRPAWSLPYQDLSGINPIGKVMRIDQKPIGRTPRSNPATYCGVFSLIRNFFAQVPESNARGYNSTRFSFNVGPGRCETCEGDGQIRLEMHFLPDVFVRCERCQGRRYNRETLEILYRGKSIGDVLNMNIDEASAFFENHNLIRHKLTTLLDVGLGYLTLGQGSPSLSGGEAQRLKLAKELSKLSKTPTLYILDEPTTGLHFHDVRKLLQCIQNLVDLGNTVVVIEHHMDVIASADWVIDLGPESGSGGGQLTYCGPTAAFTKKMASTSVTAEWLKKHLHSRA